MNTEFDPAKAVINWRRHRIRLTDAAVALDDPLAIVSEDDRHNEQRFQVIGADATGRILTVIFTYRGDSPRIISARKAENWERKLYED